MNFNTHKNFNHSGTKTLQYCLSSFSNQLLWHATRPQIKIHDLLNIAFSFVYYSIDIFLISVIYQLNYSTTIKITQSPLLLAVTQW